MTDNAVTSALTVLLLAGAFVMKTPIFAASTALFMVGSWAAASFTFLTLRQAGHALAGASAGFLIVLASPPISRRGMETALYLGLVAAAFYAVECRRYLTAGVLWGWQCWRDQTPLSSLPRWFAMLSDVMFSGCPASQLGG